MQGKQNTCILYLHGNTVQYCTLYSSVPDTIVLLPSSHTASTQYSCYLDKRISFKFDILKPFLYQNKSLGTLKAIAYAAVILHPCGRGLRI